MKVTDATRSTKIIGETNYEGAVENKHENQLKTSTKITQSVTEGNEYNTEENDCEKGINQVENGDAVESED